MTAPLTGKQGTHPLVGPPRPAAPAAARPSAAQAPGTTPDGLAASAGAHAEAALAAAAAATDLPPPPPGQPDPIRAFMDGYRPGPPTMQAGTPDDQDSWPYVKAHDPLQDQVSSGGFTAGVHLGVDPGLFYCGGLTQALADRAKARPGLATGFIHLPPDQATEATRLAKPNAALPTRAQNLAMTAQVLGQTLRGLADQRPGKGLTVLVTGFGPFQDAEDNPTGAFVRGRANLDATMRAAFGFTPTKDDPKPLPGGAGWRYVVDGRRIDLLTGVLKVAKAEADAKAGRYDQTMDQLRGQLDALEKAATRAAGKAPDAVIALGVDGSQLENETAADTRYMIETQARGFFAELTGPDGKPNPHRDRGFHETRQTTNPTLAEAYLAAERRRG